MTALVLSLTFFILEKKYLLILEAVTLCCVARGYDIWLAHDIISIVVLLAHVSCPCSCDVYDICLCFVRFSFGS
ncbi:hypothetical protein BO71DRAFT_177135 [Aspergillus ellipticus CBS 707.79]|uniref:Uncharacterized protein n=1 Tax=Aspergillus ellipticus CBS 707.79 TaxID=1448320 RepID=A0A319DGA3_9EURO|nr:hypothetical protein BO71DRAFT_177135 [Aspergillus ellipticus CBS 707.79]